MIYHLVTAAQWANRSASYYAPSSLAQEGFIHCSSRDQVPRSAIKYYTGVKDLLVLELNESALSAKLVWENTSGGTEPFPHIYGQINLEAIAKVHALPDQDEARDFSILD